MKLQLRLLAILLATVMISVNAAPEKTPPTDGAAATQNSDDAIAKFSAPSDDAVGDVLLQAMSLLGVAYRFGGNTPDNGLDCSGFIRYVFQKSLHLNLPRTAAQMARIGKAVDKSELAPGDIVFFNTLGASYSHVGMYMGNGKFIHSPRTGKNIEVSNMNQSYWASRYNGARRINRGNVNTATDSSAMAAETAGADAPAAKKSNADSTSTPVKCKKGKKCKKASGESDSSSKKAGKKAGKEHGSDAGSAKHAKKKKAQH